MRIVGTVKTHSTEYFESNTRVLERGFDDDKRTMKLNYLVQLYEYSEHQKSKRLQKWKPRFS